MIPGYDFISDSTLAMDGDGRDSDPTDPWDHTRPHGLQVAGIIAANCCSGLRGVSPNITINPVRVLGRGLRGNARDVADAITWASGGKVSCIAAETPVADVIVMAFSGRGTCPDYLRAAVKFSEGLGVRLLAAAGNQRENTANYFPANCPGVLSVGAINHEGVPASYSNWGADFSAPGGNILDPIPALGVDGSVSSLVGTSASVGFAAGQAALSLSLKPRLKFLAYFSSFSSIETNLDIGEKYQSSQKTAPHVEAAAYDSSQISFSNLVNSGNGGNSLYRALCSQSSIVKWVQVWYDTTSLTSIKIACENDVNTVTNTFQYGGTCFPSTDTVISYKGFLGLKVSFQAGTWIRSLALRVVGSDSWGSMIGPSVQNAQNYDLSCPSYFYLIGISVDTGMNCDSRMNGLQAICAPLLCSAGTYQSLGGWFFFLYLKQ